MNNKKIILFNMLLTWFTVNTGAQDLQLTYNASSLPSNYDQLDPRFNPVSEIQEYALRPTWRRKGRIADFSDGSWWCAAYDRTRIGERWHRISQIAPNPEEMPTIEDYDQAKIEAEMQRRKQAEQKIKNMIAKVGLCLM